ncbi:hypothetical protein GUITHDRAFT_49807, partial [Guillardia theta CCMP2712]
MKRCVNNNYSFSGFWRQWHASLNAWIIRYMYIPLGGRKTQASQGDKRRASFWNVWVIFTFVGLWHDLMWRWLAWAWLNCTFFCLELAVTALGESKACEGWRRSRWWRYILALCGSMNISFLVIANLSIMHGFQGSTEFLLAIFDNQG